MLEREAAPTSPRARTKAHAPAAAPTGSRALAPAPKAAWQAHHDLERHRAETERLRVLADFLARPIHAHGGPEPDPDIVTAYNLAVEAALQGIRRAASAG